MAPSTKLVLAVCLLGVASGLVLLNLSFFVTADMFLAVLPYSWELVAALAGRARVRIRPRR